MGIKHDLFGNTDFNKIASDPNCNEAGVRANIIDPMLKGLGFTAETIEREKRLEIYGRGSKKQKGTLVPDYLLKVGESYAWVLDAKAPAKNIAAPENVQQAYDYAVHMEVRCKYFALCNGVEFLCFRTDDPKKPIISFRMDKIDNYWETLRKTLSPDGFHSGKTVVYEPVLNLYSPNKAAFDYSTRPLLGEIPVKKQAAKRHFGVNAYFTRQAWNVVAEYIKNFTRKGDVVLDPFGGSGVTAVEAFMNERKAISLDINPLSVFIMKALLAPVKPQELTAAFEKVCEEYRQKEPKTKKAVKEVLREYPGPKNLPLPKGSDVEYVLELFSDEQTAQLALLKSIIKKVKNKDIRNSLLLAIYNTVSVLNKTFHEMPKGGPVGFVMYYRYRIAPKPAYRNAMETYDGKFKRILAAKREIVHLLGDKNFADAVKDVQLTKGTATNLSFLQNESVDYIYTDPPYGKKIPYLDLSVMWNAWLGLNVTEEDYKMEAIEGGEHNKSKQEYNSLIAKSIQEMYRVLKFDRWLSFVFAHKDPEFWHLIIETCEKCGFEYVGAVPQKNGHHSFKKSQHPFTVLSGELIINFRKIKSPKAVLKANLGMDIGEIVLQTVEGIIAKFDGASLEQINDELIIKGLELGFLDLLKKEYKDLTPLLRNWFDYDTVTEKYNVKKDGKFQTHFDVRLRIRYYLLSFLRRMERENKNPAFDTIVMEIMPLLKNGETPENQTILGVLKDIAEQVGADSWKLKPVERTLFD
ncbi:MAG: type I restriction enzyme HsdR N-terminal domain-containing protein [Chitinispirillales bacterium]|jgi:16S rRNA G966 N2-methylase RsmD|nr:type I restriction enzyme HsdR N-terminal domain-containing protein [Chitinispirillales bacterium]